MLWVVVWVVWALLGGGLWGQGVDDHGTVVPDGHGGGLTGA